MIRVSFYASLSLAAMTACTVSALKFQDDNVLSQMENNVESGADLDLNTDIDTMVSTENESDLDADLDADLDSDLDAEWDIGGLLKKGAGLASKGFSAAKNWLTGKKKPACKDLPWKNNHGHTCANLAKNKHAQPGWTDKKGVKAGDACCKFGGGSTKKKAPAKNNKHKARL